MANRASSLRIQADNATAVWPAVLVVAAESLGLSRQVTHYLLQPPGIAPLPVVVVVMYPLRDLVQVGGDNRQVGLWPTPAGQFKVDLLVYVAQPVRGAVIGELDIGQPPQRVAAAFAAPVEFRTTEEVGQGQQEVITGDATAVAGVLTERRMPLARDHWIGAGSVDLHVTENAERQAEAAVPR